VRRQHVQMLWEGPSMHGLYCWVLLDCTARGELQQGPGAAAGKKTACSSVLGGCTDVYTVDLCFTQERDGSYSKGQAQLQVTGCYGGASVASFVCFSASTVL
jgi:hypothetical protein